MDDTDLDLLDLEDLALDDLERLSERQIIILMARKVEEYEEEEEEESLPLNIQALLGQGNQCNHCEQYIPPLKTPQLCSRCKAVTYCGPECQTQAWLGLGRMGVRPHKILCKDNKRHMKRLPYVSAVIRQFPWGRVEENGSFNLKVAKARFDVYGSTGTGFWSHSIGENPHQDTRYNYSQHQGIVLEAHDNGHDLLHLASHLTDEQGWKLDEEFIPYRALDSIGRERWPSMVTDFAGGVHDWASWYAWRKLPLKSPAALLMDYPLTAYHLITRTLHLTNATAGDSNNRVTLNIHMLGAEVELNFLPLYSELALLLPYHDITMTVFGYGVRELARSAVTSKGSPTSPARLAFASPDTPVFEYKAPDDLGGSTLKIHLHGASDAWSWETVRNGRRPDALIAHDAGLCVYQSWAPVVQQAHRQRIPFAVTDYSEQSAEFEVQYSIPARLRPQRPHYGPGTIGLNPFHKPGQRVNRVRLPFLYNGFTIAVVDGPVSRGAEAEAEAEARSSETAPTSSRARYGTFRAFSLSSIICALLVAFIGYLTYSFVILS